MVYIGAFAVMLAAFLIWREYTSYLQLELYWCREFLDAIKDLREKMKCYLDSPLEWAKSYRGDALAKCGFLDGLKAGGNMLEVYKNTRKETCLSEKSNEILENCFGRLGEGYIDTELETIELAIAKLSEEEKNASFELTRKRRVAGAFLGACASGIVILVI